MTWSDSERKYLLDNYPILGPKECSIKLNRSESAVRAEASRLKLKKSITKTDFQFKEQLLHKGISLKLISPYVKGDVKALFECINGHKFYQRPRTVLERGKCPDCSKKGFKENLPAILYLIEYEIEGEALYKLGITNNTPQSRAAADFNRFNGTICWTVHGCGNEIRAEEYRLKHIYRDYQYNTGYLSSGNTETYNIYINKPII